MAISTLRILASIQSLHPGTIIHLHAIDIAILLVYLLFVIGIGVITGKGHQTSEDFFLSGRRIPAWITGLAFISANLGALEVMGMSQQGYEYGMMTADYYWLAVPAMVFMGIAMMPFFYGSKVRSVPEFLKKRYNEGARFINAFTFAIFTPAISGISMYALAVVLQDFLGWHFGPSVWFSAAVVLVYTFLGGLTASIYNEVLQFFLIVFGIAPMTIIGLIANHGWAHFKDWLATHSLPFLTPDQTAAVATQPAKAIPQLSGSQWLHTYYHTLTTNNPMHITWPGIVLGLGFVLGFSYWCTNFLVVQRALAAKDMNAAQRTPLLAAFPKMIFPFIVILPGVLALPLLPHLYAGNAVINGHTIPPTESYNNVMPLMMARYYPAGLLGLGLTALMASFMSGMAGNVTAFNTVVTYDLYAVFIRPNAPDQHYLRVGRILTFLGVAISVGFAYVVRHQSGIMGYTQTIFGVVNAPLIAVFLLGMFASFTTPAGGLWGLLAGTGTSLTLWIFRSYPGLPLWHHYSNSTSGAFWGALWSFCAGALVTVVVSLMTKKKNDQELVGLVYQFTPKPPVDHDIPWWKRPIMLGILALALAAILNWWFW
ncbi:MAG: sodium:solute symporter family protein [Phycisphaerae bacterium]